METRIFKKASELYPKGNQIPERNAYVKGYLDASREILLPKEEDFFETLAEKLRELWPQAEKDSKYPWRDSVKNLKVRLEFLWKDRKFKDKYTVDQCLVAARRYLSQFETSTKYMQVLKYFIFKQEKLTDTNGKVKIIYKSNLADLLEDTTTLAMSSIEFESTDTLSLEQQGELI